MNKSFQRTDRLAAVIQRELAVLLQRSLRDPRLSPLISISAVTVTRDISHAKVYVMLPAEDQNIDEQVVLLNKAAGFIRSQLSSSIQIRRVPQLRFVYDQSLAHAGHIKQLLDDVLPSSISFAQDNLD